MRKIVLFLCITFFYVPELLAGPGGKIAREVIESPVGRIISIIVFILFLPFIIYSIFKRSKAIRQTKSKLSQLSKIDNELFDEINLKNRMTDVFTRVHKAWSERDLENCEDYMTSWYRQNQQTVYLDDWDSKGLMNICTIDQVNSIKPIHIRLTENEHFEGSRIMYLIDAFMEDYLVRIEDSSIQEGEKGFKVVETIWTLKLENGKWKVDNIEESEMIPSYLKMDNQLTDEIIDSFSNKRILKKSRR